MPDLAVGVLGPEQFCERQAVHGDEGGLLDDEPPHGPEKVRRTLQAVHHELGEVARRLRVIGGELGPVVVAAAVPEQRAGAGVVELAVVQDDEAWVSDQGRPHVVVAGRVAELVDHTVIGVTEVPTLELPQINDIDEGMGTFGGGARGGHHVDRMLGREQREELGAVGRDARSLGWQRGEPGEAHAKAVVLA